MTVNDWEVRHRSLSQGVRGALMMRGFSAPSEDEELIHSVGLALSSLLGALRAERDIADTLLLAVRRAHEMLDAICETEPTIDREKCRDALAVTLGVVSSYRVASEALDSKGETDDG